MENERPANFEEVVSKLDYAKKLSPVRFEAIMEKLKAVMNGEQCRGFEDWNEDDANDVLNSVC
jgi:hypothetical protein